MSISIDLDIADRYAALIQDLAALARSGNYVTANLACALDNARRDFDAGDRDACRQCIQTLAYAMQDEDEANTSVIYNAVLHWAIKGLHTD